MKLTIFFLLAAIALAAAKPTVDPHHHHHHDRDVRILKSSFDLDPAGSYKFGYETENHITRDEVGQLKVVKNEEGKDEPVVVVKGSYSYQDPEGKPISVVFFADETGFHAEGAHLPVA